MAIVELDDIFNPGVDILGTTLDDKGTILAQTGDVVGEEVASDNAEMWQHIGFASRPAKAQGGKSACQAITLNQGSNDLIIATRDLRGSQIYGNLGEGETCIYAGGPEGTSQAKVLVKADGSITLYTTDDNTPNGAGVYFRIGPDKLSFIAPWGRLLFDAAGLHIETQNGGGFDLSNVNSPPLIVNGSSCRITATTVSLDAPQVFLGPSAASGTASGGVFFGAAYGIVPPVAPSIPILGTGAGAVTVAASTSTKVWVSI